MIELKGLNLKQLISWFLVAMASMACADDQLIAVENVDGWQVFVDPTAGNACFIQKEFEDGIRVRFGLVPERDGGFFSAMSKDWTHIKTGTKGTVKFFTSEEKFAGDVDMVSEGDLSGGWVFFNNPKFTTEMAKRNSIKVVGPEDGAFEVELSGSSHAINAMNKCQEAQN